MADSTSSDPSGPLRRSIPYARPLWAEIDRSKGTRPAVVAAYPAVGGNARPEEEGILRRLIRIAKATSEAGQDRAISAFVMRHGLLDYPRGERASGKNSGLEVEYRERVEDYVWLSKVLSASLAVWDAFKEGRRIDSVAAAELRRFHRIHTDLAENTRLFRSGLQPALLSVWERDNEPVPSEYTEASGNLPQAWRDLQGTRAIEVYNVWTRLGDVRPLLLREGTSLRLDLIGGGTWGAVSAEFQQALLGRSRSRVCAYCDEVFETPVRRRRIVHGHAAVTFCCSRASCRRERQREASARYRSKRSGTSSRGAEPAAPQSATGSG